MKSSRARLRNYILAVGSLGLFSVPAPAQILAPMTCDLNSLNTPARQEGKTELLSDLLITCTGGTVNTLSTTQTPTATFTLTLPVSITSRILSTAGGNVSEALLLIDDPGTSAVPLVAGFGNNATPVVCPDALNGCPSFPNVVSGFSVMSKSPAPLGFPATGAPNVYQGVVSGNQIRFFNVPVIPPGTTATRTFRFTNVRMDATIGFAGPVVGTLSIDGSGAPLISLPQYQATLATIQSGLTPSASGRSLYCAPQTYSYAGTLTFTENYGAAFRRRVFPSAVSNSGQSNAVIQNLPGRYFSESGYEIATGSGVAGLADFGTRLKAVINNVPVGGRVFVSFANVTGADSTSVGTISSIYNTAAVGSSNVTSLAELIAGGETAIDTSSAPLATPQFLSSPAAVTSPGIPSASFPFVELAVSEGSATAVWEVLNTDPFAVETFSFDVFVTVPANVGSAHTANLSYAPTSSSAFIPQFANTLSTASFANVLACITISGPNTLPAASEGAPYSQIFSASGGSGVYVWTATGLPAGLAMTPAGTLGGIPAAGSHGAYNVQATVTDSNGAAIGVTLPLTIAATQTITFSAIANRPFGTPAFEINATASSGLAVIFASTTPAVCTVAGATVTLVSAGTCTIQAAQPGNSVYSAAPPVSQSFQVTGASQTIGFSPLANQPLGTAPFSVSATASSGLAVSFAVTTPAVCSVALSTVTLISMGSCTIVASQPGNANYAAATPVSQTFQVSAQTQTITFDALPNQPLGTAPFELHATASSGLPVSFASITPAVCTVADATVMLVSTGTCVIDAMQPGNASYAAAPGVIQRFQVTTTTQTIIFDPLPNQSLGALPFLASATASSGLAVSFASTTPAVCSIAGVTVMLVSVGTCTIQATQAGNATYAAAPPVTESFQVTLGHQTISFGALPDEALGTDPFAISATASSGLPVSFTSKTSTVCTVSGSNVTLVATGTCTIQATQDGNANYAAAPPVNQSFQVTSASQEITITTLSIPPAIHGVVYPTTMFQVHGGMPPFTWSATGFPAGLALSAGGILSGTPISGGQSYEATVTVVDGSAPQALTATRAYGGTVSIGNTPLIASPRNLSFSYTQGDPALPASEGIGVLTTPAGVPVTASAATSDGGTWLIITNDFTSGQHGSQTPGNVLVSVDPSGLAPKTYNGQVTITAPSATPSVVTVNVTFTVLAAALPQLSITAARQDFALVQGGEPIQGQILISNSGGGTLQFAAKPSSDANWLTLTGNTSGTLSPSSSTALNFVVNPGQMPSTGLQWGKITVTDAVSGAQAVTPITLAVNSAEQAMQLSESELVFTAVVNGTNPPAQPVFVLNLGQGSMAWTTHGQTFPSGQNWLNATSTGTSLPGAAGPVFVSVNSAGLAAGQYYGLVQVAAPTAANTMQAISVELIVVEAGQLGSAPQVSTGGVVLSGITGGTSPSVPVNLSDPQGRSLTYTTNVFTTDGGNWLSVANANGSLSSTGFGALKIQANLAGVMKVRYGTVQVAFDEGTVHTIGVAAIPTGTALPAVSALNEKSLLRPLDGPATGGCQSSTLVAKVQTPEQSQVVRVAQAQSVKVQVLDDCGVPVTGQGATVKATFSNGDAGVALVDVGGGMWAGSWTPATAQMDTTLQVNAYRTGVNGSTSEGETAVTGIAVIPADSDSPAEVSVALNAATLDIGNTGLVVPGAYVTIFGRRLASAIFRSTGLPLPVDFGHTRLLLGSQPLPLLYVSPTQVNAVVPRNLALNTNQQLFIERDKTVSAPLLVTVMRLQPGIFTLQQTGHGQGAILVGGTTLVAGPTAPGSRPVAHGEYVEIYCTGLGQVQGGNEELEPGDGQAAPASGNILYKTVANATVTIGGVPAPVVFAGLAPGFVSLYQVNVKVPDAAPAGDAVPVILTMTGKDGSVSSPPVTIAVQ